MRIEDFNNRFDRGTEKSFARCKVSQNTVCSDSARSQKFKIILPYQQSEQNVLHIVFAANHFTFICNVITIPEVVVCFAMASFQKFDK